MEGDLGYVEVRVCCGGGGVFLCVGGQTLSSAVDIQSAVVGVHGA
jgi:hypothetical protein